MPSQPTTLITLYCSFAVIATIVNIASQELSIQFYQGWAYIPLSIIVGTATGLITKYLLDKKYIFKFHTKDLAQDSKTFFLYSLMGVLTTVIFWGFELSFELLFNDKTMRYIGACIGLAIGYIIKYHLDKKFVFV